MNIIKAKVLSAKMKNTAVVTVITAKAHPMYKKIVRRTKKYHVHNAMGAKAGDMVMIKQCRPISKTKSWIIFEILK